MNDDFVERLRDLPPQLADVADRVDQVRRIVSRRRRRQVGLAATATAVAVIVPVAVVSGLPSHQGRAPVTHHDTHHATHSGLAGIAMACPAPGLSITALPPSEHMTHTVAEVRTSLGGQRGIGHIVNIHPAMVKDPIAGKVELGSPTAARRMWLVYRLTIVRLPSFRNTATGTPSAALNPQAGTRVAALSLVDDTALAPGGNFACGPVTTTTGNVGYGIAAGSRVDVTGIVDRAGTGFVLCYIGAFAGTALTSGGSPCEDQIALAGDARELPHWSGQNRDVEGIWQHDGIQVASIGPPRNSDDDPSLINPPCTTPTGGWASVPPSVTPNLDYHAFAEYRSQHPGIVVTVASFRPSNLTPVLTLASTDPAATKSALAAAYPRQLCVVPSRFTVAQVHRARRDVKRAFLAGKLPGVSGFGGGETAQAQATMDLTSLSDRPAIHDALPHVAPGLLVIHPWITILAAPPSS